MGCEKCGRPGCAEGGALLRNGQRFCVKHARFNQMRVTAKRHGKTVPTWEQLENLLSWTNGMICKDCGCKMNWRRPTAATQITLQHYRSGSLALVCLACNTKHAKMPGDTYVGLQKGHKWCPGCVKTKPLTEFSRRKSRSTLRPWIARSLCRECRTQGGAERRAEETPRAERHDDHSEG